MARQAGVAREYKEGDNHKCTESTYMQETKNNVSGYSERCEKWRGN
jgi:hypothetical protein